MAIVRLIVSPYFSPPLTLDLIERLYVLYGVKLHVEMDLSLSDEYYFLELEERGAKRKGVFHAWEDLERSIVSLLSGLRDDSDAVSAQVRNWDPLEGGAHVFEL